MLGSRKGASRLIALILAAALAAPPAPAAEARVVEYLKAHVKPGQPVVVSELYNTVFTAPEERAALNRLFNTFFKMPLYLAQHVAAAGKPPTLAEISEQFHFEVPGAGRRDAADHGVGPPHAALHHARRGDGRDHERGRRRDPRPPAVRQGARAHDHGLGGQARARLRDDDLRREAAGLGVPGREAAPPLLLVHGLPALRADRAAPRRARPRVRARRASGSWP